jgi:GPI ethanolamine phosphate transferase 1
MALIGILYLVFEDFVLSDFSATPTPRSKHHGISRILTGVQVGWVLLAMVVTRSSALSLQAKQGLPPGNQLVGWLVLGKFISPSRFLFFHSDLSWP